MKKKMCWLNSAFPFISYLWIHITENTSWTDSMTIYHSKLNLQYATRKSMDILNVCPAPDMFCVPIMSHNTGSDARTCFNALVIMPIDISETSFFSILEGYTGIFIMQNTMLGGRGIKKRFRGKKGWGKNGGKLHINRGKVLKMHLFGL